MDPVHTSHRHRFGSRTSRLDRLLEGAHFEVVHTPKADFTAAQALFREDSDLSFVDATLAAFLHREGLEYRYSFDDDFDAIDGVTRLETADNPRH